MFLDVDCDVFDPAWFPAVTQPVPFGLSPSLVLRLLDAVWSPKVAVFCSPSSTLAATATIGAWRSWFG